MHCSETLESTKAAIAANDNRIINTEITKEKAEVLDEFEQIVTAAMTKLTELKNLLTKASS